VVWPAKVILIIPAHIHIHMEVSFKAGILPIMTVGAPGVHGPGVAGTHGIGVRTPAAAVVAVATVGLTRLWHIPKGIMFSIGI